ncbi:protein ROOT PRIMORDIUM DEFECTIVE 1-like [Chenopodium quinoa]|uniref:protein ROOT PRIMORDIUM DEFECTIVE 1-like n=1 Tax=Chenopodium quinoa TaxID=63459 RepID=UPI000B78063F|nr:protein ROOT PRIMORDIUM DEFECTIVE 1-like [Chenopodium quinoa]XP_021730120.1 protein ROOT PRIMORDIUM DEFECTIVE 1-like [Chenopodium quinoa]XP_021730121.1 protein ROOT PRIMORDIUM DEFECTIVE 1-like [Chenopodium quinoa]
MNNIRRTSNLIQIKPTLRKSNPSISSFLQQTLKNALIFTRQLSKKSTSIPKNQLRVRDHAFDNYMEVEKKIRKVLKFQELIIDQPQQCIPVARLDFLARRIGFKRDEAGKFVLKLPKIFEIYEHPVQRILYLRFTRNALLQIEQEKHAINANIPDAVTRLRKLLMLSNSGRLHLEHIRIARRDFGLPDDFEYSVVLKYPQYFRLFDAKDCMSKYIEIVKKDPRLAVCAVDRVRESEYRKKGIDEESTRFSFVVNFPPGFKIGKYYKIAMWKWQRIPYWPPYEDVSGHDMRSLEAQNRMEKRAVAMIHELLSLTVEKKITLERIAHFRVPMDLPKKLKDFLLQHQGIFYISTRGNQGKLHTIFLREAYRKGDLIEPNDVYLARRRLAELILVSPRMASSGRELVSYTRPRDDVTGSRKGKINDSDNFRRDRVGELDLDSESDSDVESCFSDEDEDGHHVRDTQAAR